MSDIINIVDGKVQVIFKKGESTQIYCDALWFTEEEYAGVSSETLETMKQERYDNWLSILNAPPTEELPPADNTEP